MAKLKKITIKKTVTNYLGNEIKWNLVSWGPQYHLATSPLLQVWPVSNTNALSCLSKPAWTRSLLSSLLYWTHSLVFSLTLLLNSKYFTLSPCSFEQSSFVSETVITGLACTDCWLFGYFIFLLLLPLLIWFYLQGCWKICSLVQFLQECYIL